ncbi:MAG: ABC transporter substrate-binding protein [Desulfurococcaceae archaeon]
MDRLLGISRSVLIAVIVIVIVAVAGISAYLMTAPAPAPTPTPTPMPTPTTPPLTTPTPAPILTPTPTPTTPTTPATPLPTPTPTPTPIIEMEELRIGAKVDIATPDIHRVTGIPAVAMMNHVFETLLKLDYDERGNLVLKPWLAEGYRWINETALELTLRKGVLFHCGGEFDAEAVKFSIERLLKEGGPAASTIAMVEEVVVIDKYTVVLKLKHPFAPLPYVLTYGPIAIVSPAAPTSCGTGPYKLVTWEKGVRTVFERFENYWGPKPAIKRIVWIPIPDDASRVAALEAGDVDYIDSVPPQDITRLQAKGFNVLVVPGIRTMFIGFNIEKWPWNITEVRQALNYAVDKQALIKQIFQGYATVMDSPLPPSIWSYKPQPVYEYNPEKAKRMLREAGVPEGLKIELVASTGRYLLDREVVTAIAEYLRAVGLDVEVKLYDWGTYQGKVLPERQFDLYFLGIAGGIYGDPDGCLYIIFVTGQGFNNMGYSNPVVDDVLSKARASLNVEERKALYEQAQAIIWKDAPWIFLYYQPVIVASRPDLRGVKVFPSEAFYMGEAHLIRT